MWVLLRYCTNITDKSVDAIADKYFTGSPGHHVEVANDARLSERLSSSIGEILQAFEVPASLANMTALDGLNLALNHHG